METTPLLAREFPLLLAPPTHRPKSGDLCSPICPIFRKPGSSVCTNWLARTKLSNSN